MSERSPEYVVGRAVQLNNAPVPVQSKRFSARLCAMTVTREALERAVVGALKSAIDQHGPITKDKLTSAAKRVVGNLVNAGVPVEKGPSGSPPKTPSK